MVSFRPTQRDMDRTTQFTSKCPRRSYAYRLPKFQGTNTLSIFIASNQGDEETTHVSKLVVSGMSVQGMNVADIKKGEEG